MDKTNLPPLPEPEIRTMQPATEVSDAYWRYTFSERQMHEYAARAVREAVPGWRPIETAPKDGTVVLVYVPRRSGAIYAGASNPTGTQWWSRNLGALKPTHWMPLPEPPK